MLDPSTQTGKTRDSIGLSKSMAFQEQDLAFNIKQNNVDFHWKRLENMYEFPADNKSAMLHKIANMFGYRSKNSKDKQSQYVCSCCELPIEKLKINITQKTTPSEQNKAKNGNIIFPLNSGSAMFFTFIKMTICYLLMRFLISDAYNLVTSVMAHYCLQYPSECSDFSSRLSAYNKKTPEDEETIRIVDILNLTTVVLSIIFFYFYRKYQFQVYKIANNLNHTQDGYTLLVENIPIIISSQLDKNQYSYRHSLKEIFEGHLQKWINEVQKVKGQTSSFEKDVFDHCTYNIQKKRESPKIRSISLCFDLTEIQKIAQLRQNLMKEHISYSQKSQNGSQLQAKTDLIRKINFTNQQHMLHSIRFASANNISFNLSHFVGKAFISFQYKYYKDYFLRCHKDSNQIQIDGNKLTLSSAANPTDVYWSNMKVSDSKRTISTIYSYIILSMSLGLSFGLLLGLQIFQNKITPEIQASKNLSVENKVMSYAFTLIMTGMINGINYLLSLTAKRLTKSQKQNSKSHQITSLMIKDVIAQFLNSSIIIYIISLMYPDIPPLSSDGIIVSVMSLVGVSGLIQIVTNLTQPLYLYDCFMNKRKYEKSNSLFQIQLNQALQYPEFDFQDRYAYYVTQIFVVSFYAIIAPSITLILAFIFFFQYWIDKYNLFKRYSCTIDFSYRLARLTVLVFEMSIAIFAIGNYIFSIDFHTTNERKYYNINLITLAIAVCYCLLAIFAPKSWEDKLFVFQSFQRKSYTKCLADNNFMKLYWTSNPATSFAIEQDLNIPQLEMANKINYQVIPSAKNAAQPYQKRISGYQYNQTFKRRSQSRNPGYLYERFQSLPHIEPIRQASAIAVQYDNLNNSHISNNYKIELINEIDNKTIIYPNPHNINDRQSIYAPQSPLPRIIQQKHNNSPSQSPKSNDLQKHSKQGKSLYYLAGFNQEVYIKRDDGQNERKLHEYFRKSTLLVLNSQGKYDDDALLSQIQELRETKYINVQEDSEDEQFAHIPPLHY